LLLREEQDDRLVERRARLRRASLLREVDGEPRVEEVEGGLPVVAQGSDVLGKMTALRRDVELLEEAVAQSDGLDARDEPRASARELLEEVGAGDARVLRGDCKAMGREERLHVLRELGGELRDGGAASHGVAQPRQALRAPLPRRAARLLGEVGPEERR